MGRLADDCFASGGDVLRADEALRILSARLKPIASVVTLPLRQLRGRVLAEDIVSPRNVPPHDNAAVDGYAVYFDDLSADGETRLKIGPRIAAGHPHSGEVPHGIAARIFTGAAMPQGPDTVFMQEDVRVEGDVAIFPPGQKRFANRRQAGEDIHTGKTILHAGHRLRAADIGLIASVGLTQAKVFAKLRIAVFSTGDELREPGTATPPGSVYDSNRYALMALLEQAGAIVSDLGILPDNAAALRDALASAAGDHDAIVTSGGMSTGEEDHVRAAVTANGALDFWRLAIRPGRPVALGNVKGTAFIGLPGNPVAMIVTYLRFARPVLSRLGGAADAAPLRFKLACETAIKKKPGRREWVRASVTYAADGSPILRPFPLDGAGILTSLVESDGLIELAEDTADVAPGTRVEFLPFSELLA
ncbi:MAG: molybdopterin molybdotransferase MoeA [Alphaproteobacteria bacterium]|nr:molybdopterin molybdotransferase MoeA [Alphaproteobacteria bacterium]